tara:strand:+ start:23333 stop:23974 length:642 start_codon:yes stop_codon:yes gene_type:complete
MTITVSPCILLDFDGVVLKNKKVDSYITKKSIEHVAVSRNISLDHAKQLNTKLYPKLGHTSLINTDIHSLSRSIKEYNNYVFNELDYSKIDRMLTKNDKSYVHKIFEIPNEQSIPLGIFTNAPLSWCESVLMLCDIDINKEFSEKYLFTSDNSFVKPLQISYDVVEKSMKNRHIFFIDDKKSNLEPIEDKNKWSGIHLDEKTSLHEIMNYLLC